MSARLPTACGVTAVRCAETWPLARASCKPESRTLAPGTPVASSPQRVWRPRGDDHLADQIVPFLALAREESDLTSPTASSHLRTVAWVVQQFVPARITLDEGPFARLRVAPAG